MFSDGHLARFSVQPLPRYRHSWTPALLALLVVTRYMQHEQDTNRICANEPTASVRRAIIECGWVEK
jgi:hypothetical protein